MTFAASFPNFNLFIGFFLPLFRYVYNLPLTLKWFSASDFNQEMKTGAAETIKSDHC